MRLNFSVHFHDSHDVLVIYFAQIIDDGEIFVFYWSRLFVFKINLDDIEEKFICGGGRGGQKINKSTNAVQLKHIPTGILIKYQKHRERAMNRILALRELLEKLNPSSKKQQEIEKIRKQKKRRRRKSEKSADSKSP